MEEAMDDIGLMKALGLGSQYGACIEARGASTRVRWRAFDRTTRRIKRHSLRLPDEDTIKRARAFLERARHDREIAKMMTPWLVDAEKANRSESRALLSALRKKLLAACEGGAVVRQRLGKAFDSAAEMGLEVLEDFIKRGPWEATGRPAGRPVDTICLK